MSRPTRHRFSLRVEVGGEVSPEVERAMLALAKVLPGATLSRTDHDDHGDYLIQTQRVALWPERSRRKAHRRLNQREAGEWVIRRGGATQADVAAHFGVSEATCKRNLDGLVYQGVLAAEGPSGRSRRYLPPTA